jgi:hypothetical protein
VKSRAALLGAAAFCIVAGLGVLRHEMWRDELEIWLIALGSGNPLELIRNMGTEGHPVVWYALNFLLTRVTDAPLAMQLLNLAFGTTAAWVVLRFAPFDLPARLAFCFGYYLLYEFTVISRGYALALLLAFGFCAHFARRARLDVAGGLLLLLLANTTLYGTIVAAHLVLLVAASRLVQREAQAPSREGPGIALALVGVAIGLGHTLSQSLAIGPAHAGFYRPHHDMVWIASCLGTLFRGAVPLPDPSSVHSWNSQVLDLLPAPWSACVGAALGVAGLALAIGSLRRQPLLAGVFALGTLVMLSIVFFVWFGSMRHHGQVFLWYFVCAWLGTALGQQETPQRLPSRDTARPLLLALLVTQVLAAAHAWVVDLARPFSQARAVGAYLRRDELADLALVGSRDYAMQPVAAYARRAFYYPESGHVGTFLDWGPGRRLVSPREVVEAVHDLALSERRDVLLVLNYDLPLVGGRGRIALGDGVELEELSRFTGSIVPDEEYVVWRASLTEPTSAGDNGPGPDD